MSGDNVRQTGGFPGGSHCERWWVEVVRLKGVKTARVSLEAFEPESRDVESRDEHSIWSGDLFGHMSPDSAWKVKRSCTGPPNFDSFHHIGYIFP